MSTGEDVEIKEQLQFYTVNSLLNHPLVSPITGYLGGLPPLLFIAGDEEVLRDEIIYTLVSFFYFLGSLIEDFTQCSQSRIS